MNPDLLILAGLAEGWIWPGLLLFLRIGAITALAPAFGEEAVPARVKLVAALAITWLVAPLAPAPTAAAGGAAALSAAAAEVCAGLLFGLALRLCILALQMAGAMAAQSISLAQIAGGGAAAEPAPAVGHLLVVGGLALAAAGDLHLRICLYVLISYDLIPIGGWPAAAAVFAEGPGLTARAFGLAFSLALPFVIGALLYNLALGAINRAMPQLMVTFIGAPALSAGALAMLALAAPLMLEVWRTALDGALSLPFGGAP